MSSNTITSVDVKKLEPFKKFIMTIGELPTSYLESMTYGEMVMWFCNYLQNTVIPTVNNNGDVVNELIKMIEQLDVDQILSELYELQTQIISLNNNKADKTQVASDISELNTTLRQIMQQDYQTLKDYSDAQDELLQHQIDNFSADNIQTYDPTTGQISPLEVVLSNIYDQTRGNALTASEFDALDLTVTAFTGYDITAQEFDTSSKIILV